MATAQESAKIAKQIFDLCNAIGEGVHDRLHLLWSSDDYRLPEQESKQTYRGYHADGYCFDISKEPVYLSEDEVNLSAIDGFEYIYMEGIYEGFKDLSDTECLALLRSHK